MFRHVVMFRWADDVDTAHVGEIARRLDELPVGGHERQPAVAAHRVGGRSGDGLDQGAVLGQRLGQDPHDGCESPQPVAVPRNR